MTLSVVRREVTFTHSTSIMFIPKHFKATVDRTSVDEVILSVKFRVRLW